MQTPGEVTFSARFPRLFVTQLLSQAMLAIPALAVFAAWTWFRSGTWTPAIVVGGLMLVFVPLTTAIGASMASRTPRVSLSPQGIRAYDTRGRLQTAAWDAITNVRYQNRLGVKNLLFNAPHSTFDLAIPLFVEGLPQLRETAARFAGADHPLVQKLIELGD